MISARASLAILRSRSVRVATLGLLLAALAIVLDEIHFQSLASWATGIPPFAPKECLLGIGMTICKGTVSTDALTLAILASIGVPLMVGIAIKRRYSGKKLAEG
jgi:hypothetical protein